jgi:predicted RND superfamily exporter protein
MKNTIGNHPDRRERLELLSSPVAILHDGMYVYANPAYLKLFGYQTLAELQGIPVLDMLEASEYRLFSQHVAQAAVTSLNAPDLPTAELTFTGRNNTPHEVTATSHGYLLDDEACVEIWLRTEDQQMPVGALSSKPLRYYSSIILLVLFALVPLFFLPSLDIDNAPGVYFPKDEPAVILDNRLREQFPSDQVYILLFEGPALYSEEFLLSYHRLAKTLDKNPLVERLYGVTTQDHIAGSDDGFIVEPLLNTSELDNSTAAQRAVRASSDRFANSALVASNSSALSMVVAPVTLDNSLQRLQLQKNVLAAVDEAGLTEYLAAETGFIALDIAELQSMLRDNIIFIPATALIGLLLIWWLYRRWLAVILCAISLSVVVTSMVSLFVLADQPYTLISSILPPLLSALTVAALVHLYNALHYASQRGLTGKQRVAFALHEVHRPALFTALTTAAGMLSLTTSPIPAIRNFGLVAAIGVLFIYLVVFIILPPVISEWDCATWKKNGAGLRWMDIAVKHLYRTGIRYPAWTLGIAITLLAAGIPALWDVKVETSLQEFFAPDHPTRRNTDYFESKMSGTGNLNVIFETQETGGLKKPGYLAFIRSFQSWAESLPEVDKSVSAADFIEEMNWGFNAEDPSFRKIPDDPKLISQYLFIYDGEDIFDFIDPEFRISHVSLSINTHPANEITALMEKIRGYLDKQAPEDLQWEIAGYSRLFADMEELLVKGQISSLWGALVLIFLLMLVLWRSVGSALLCMLPNLSPILLIFIVMGLFGLWLDMATAMIASVAVGIAVDDTIHVYHGYISRIKAGTRPVVALTRTFNQAGRAVVTTTLVLSAQFMTLTASLFQPTVHFGFLTSIGLLAALLFDLLLLPAVLILSTNCKTYIANRGNPVVR